MGGRADLAAGRVRFVGDARRRIAEDYLRILRFFRFHARFGRGAPDAAALAACAELAPGHRRPVGRARPAGAVADPGGAEPLRPRWRRCGRPACWHGSCRGRGAARARSTVAGAGRAAAARRPVPPVVAARVEALADRLRLVQPRARAAAGAGATAMPDSRPARRRSGWRSIGWGHGLYGDLVRLGHGGGRHRRRRGGRAAGAGGGLAGARFPLGGADLLALGVPAGPELGRMLAEVRREWEEADFSLDRDACLARAAALAAATRRHLTP